jgi:transposase InsO family protein
MSINSGELESTVSQQLNDSQFYQEKSDQLAFAERKSRRYRRMAENKVGDKNHLGGFSKALDWISFYGEDDDAEEFIERFEFNCEKGGINTDERKLVFLRQLAKGEFKDFLKTLKEESITGDETQDYTKFNNVLKAFNTQYLGEERMKTYKGKLGSVTQDGSSIEEYSSRMQEIFSKLPGHYMNAAAKLDKYIDNLDGVYKEYLIERDPKSLLSAIEMAKRKERSLNSRITATRSGRTVKVNAVEAATPAPSAELIELRKEVNKLTGIVTKLTSHVSNSDRPNTNSNNYRSSYYSNRPRYGGSAGPGPKTCFHCRKEGHFKWDCEEYKASLASNTKSSSSFGAKPSVRFNVPSSSAGYSDKKIAKIQALLAMLGSDDEDEDDKPKSKVNSVTAVVNEVASICELNVDSSNRPSALTAEVMVEGVIHLRDTAVDTGSAVSAVKESVVNMLPESVRNSVKPLTSKIVYKSASGGRLNPLGIVPLNIAIGGSSVGQLDFIVFGNLDTEMLIGMNSLRSGKFGAINPVDNTIVYQPGDKLTKKIIQLNSVHRLNSLSVETAVISVCSIYSISTIRLEPNSETLIWDTRVNNLPTDVRTNVSGSVTLLVEPIAIGNYGNNMLSGFSELVNYSLQQSEVPIRLLNNTNQPIRLNAGTQLATVEVIDDTQVVPIDYSRTHVQYGLSESPLSFVRRNGIPINSVDQVDPYFDTLPDLESDLVVTNISLEDQIKSLVDLECKDGLINVDEAKQLQSLLLSKELAFAINPKKPTTTTRVEHHIDTGDARPINIPPYRVPKVHEEFIQEEMKGLIDNGLVVKSDSPWGFPVVVAPKKGGAKRFCIDYRRLNQSTRTSSYPLPLISDLLDNFAGAKYFSSIDLASGYWQIRVAVEDQDKTTFNTKYGSYKWLVMPFGLCTAPATFQRMMDEVLGDLKWRGICCYFDDIFIYSRTFIEHMKLIEAVLDRLISAQLQAKVSKCEFLKKELVFVGHLVSAEGIRPDPSKIESVRSYPVPKCTRDIRSFVGLCSYYRKFIENFSTIAASLHHLQSDKVKFVWTAECQIAFEALKLALINHPILVSPDFNLPFFIKTDASDKGVGFVLGQIVDGAERVIAYGSKTLNRAQRNYSTSDKECYAVVYACKANKHYLLGRPFIVYTDHMALKYLQTMKLGQDLSGRLARYQMFLQQFQYEVQYKKGSANNDADALSRIPYSVEECVSGVAVGTINLVDIDYESELCELNNQPDVSTQLIPNNELVVRLNPNLTRVKGLQREDKLLNPLIQYLESGILPIDDDFLVSELRKDAKKNYVIDSSGLLFNIWSNGNPKQKNAVLKRLVIPDCLKHEILFLMHADRYAGHIGINKTYSKVRDRYYWKNMYSDTENLVKSCIQCNTRKDPKKRPEVPVHMRIPDGGPFDNLVVDALGPFKKTKLGNTHIVIFIDTLTKWPECFAVKSIDAKTIARLLAEEIVPRHGCPRTLLSDRGSSFISDLMYEVYAFLNIHKLNTTAYNPQANGLVERFNHTLVNMLSMYVKDNQEDWDEHIAVCQFAYRICVNDSTQHSPFYMLYGREATLPVDAMLQVPEQFLNNADYVSELLGKLNSAHRIAKENLLEMKTKRESNNSELNYRLNYNEGDRVYLFVPDSKVGKSNKLRHRWHGPFEVLERLSAVNYRIQLIGTNGKARKILVVNVRRLKPATEPNIISQRAAEATKYIDDILFDYHEQAQRVQDRSLVEGDSANQYEVERIVDKRPSTIRPGGIEYLVKWKDYSTRFNTWEPLSNLGNSAELIEEYEASVRVQQ